MARLIFPKKIEEQKDLLIKINSKHLADGASSVLIPILTHKQINLNDDITAITSAEQHDINQKKLYLQAEYQVEMRDKNTDTILSFARGAIQYLKAFYNPLNRTLGEWGVTVDSEDRINYPTKFALRMTLMQNIKTKHDSFPPNTSPLQYYLEEHSIDINQIGNAITDAENFDINFQKTRRNAKLETQLRENLRTPVLIHIKEIGTYLMKLFKGKEKVLGDWGFTIDHSPRSPKERKCKLLPQTKITIQSVVLGSTLTNLSNSELHLFKGKTIKSIPIIIPPKEKLRIPKKFSNLTILNTSNIETAKFIIKIHR